MWWMNVEKAKNDYKPGRSLLKKSMIFIVICIVVVFGLALAASFAMMFILEQTRSGEFVEELPLELVPTAEYLLKYPIPTPIYLFIDEPRTFQYENEEQAQTQICAFMINFSIGEYESRFFVNGSRLPSHLVSSYNLLSRRDEREPVEENTLERRTNQVCIDLPLKQGLHLIEFQPSVLHTLPNYQWAIEIK